MKRISDFEYEKQKRISDLEYEKHQRAAEIERRRVEDGMQTTNHILRIRQSLRDAISSSTEQDPTTADPIVIGLQMNLTYLVNRLHTLNDPAYGA